VRTTKANRRQLLLGAGAIMAGASKTTDAGPPRAVIAGADDPVPTIGYPAR